MSTRLNLRVMAVFSIVSLPLLALAALLVIGAGRSDLRESYGLQLRQIAEHIASATDAVVYRLVINASLLGHHPNLRDAASAATRVAYNEAAALEFDESWQRASSIPGPPAALLTNPTSRFFADLISQDSFSSEILLTDRFGRLVAASGQTSDYVQADEDWWTGAFGDGIRGRLFVSGVGYDESAQTEAIAIAVPVTTEDSVVGVIKVITDIRAITSLVSGMRIGVTGDAMLVRPNGSIVLSGAGPSAPPADFFASGVLRERLGDVPSGILSQLSFSAPATNGEMRLVGVASSQLAASYPSLDWLVAVSQAEDELFGPVDAHAQWLLLMLALAAITMLFLAILFSRQLAAPPVPDDTHLSTHPKISRTDDLA